MFLCGPHLPWYGLSLIPQHQSIWTVHRTLKSSRRTRVRLACIKWCRNFCNQQPISAPLSLSKNPRWSQENKQRNVKKAEKRGHPFIYFGDQIPMPLWKRKRWVLLYILLSLWIFVLLPLLHSKVLILRRQGTFL